MSSMPNPEAMTPPRGFNQPPTLAEVEPIVDGPQRPFFSQEIETIVDIGKLSRDIGLAQRVGAAEVASMILQAADLMPRIPKDPQETDKALIEEHYLIKHQLDGAFERFLKNYYQDSPNGLIPDTDKIEQFYDETDTLANTSLLKLVDQLRASDKNNQHLIGAERIFRILLACY